MRQLWLLKSMEIEIQNQLCENCEDYVCLMFGVWGADQPNYLKLHDIYLTKWSFIHL